MIQKKFFFALSKYVSFGLKFAQALLIAKYLGPVGFAVFGFAQLLSLYVSFIHFGIPLSMHTMLSISQSETKREFKSYISDGFWFLLLLGTVLCISGFVAVFIFPNLFTKFQFARYGVMAIASGVNLFMVQYFANVYQVFGQYIRIALADLVSVLLLFATVVLLKKDDPNVLLYWILLVNALNLFVNFVFFLYKPPFNIKLIMRKAALKPMINIGIPMLIATVGFYLITISVRTVSTYYYDLHEIGLFTFGISVSNAVMMGLNAISWTFYSTVLANTSGDIDKAYRYVQKVNNFYNFGVGATIFVGVLTLPVLFFFLPAYEEFYKGISILLFSQIFLSVSFGYNCLIVAQQKQRWLARISFITLALVIALSIMVCLLRLPFLYQTGVILIGMICYSTMICYIGAKISGMSVLKVLKNDLLDYRVLLPTLCWFLLLISEAHYLWGVLPCALFAALNIESARSLFEMVLNRKSTK